MTTIQATLPLDLVEPEYVAEMTLAERYAAFSAANPIVLLRLEQMTAEWLSAGHKRASIAQFFEVLRHESGLSTTGSVWKLDNSFRAFFARSLIACNPEWAGAFELRAQKAA